MAYEKITAYRLDDGTITESLDKAEESDKRAIFISKLEDIYNDSDFAFLASEFQTINKFIWGNRTKILEALK